MTESAGGITISKTRPCQEQMMKNNSPSIKHIIVPQISILKHSKTLNLPLRMI